MFKSFSSPLYARTAVGIPAVAGADRGDGRQQDPHMTYPSQRDGTDERCWDVTGIVGRLTSQLRGRVEEFQELMSSIADHSQGYWFESSRRSSHQRFRSTAGFSGSSSPQETHMIDIEEDQTESFFVSSQASTSLRLKRRCLPIR